MKVQIHSSLEPLLEYNQDQDAFDKSRLVMTNQLGSYRNIMQFQISSRGENK